jgi:hypothetical protein
MMAMEMESRLRLCGSVAVSALFSDRNLATSISKRTGSGENPWPAYLAWLVSEADATGAERNSEHFFVFADVSAGLEKMLA